MAIVKPGIQAAVQNDFDPYDMLLAHHNMIKEHGRLLHDMAKNSFATAKQVEELTHIQRESSVLFLQVYNEYKDLEHRITRLERSNGI